MLVEEIRNIWHVCGIVFKSALSCQYWWDIRVVQNPAYWKLVSKTASQETSQGTDALSADEEVASLEFMEDLQELLHKSGDLRR